FSIVEEHLSVTEKAALERCIVLGNEAVLEGNPPIGAVWIDNKRGLVWEAKTTDKTNPRLHGHAEILGYRLAEDIVKDELASCTLVTSAEPCVTCTSTLAEGKIGRIIYAAPRWAV